VCSWGDCLDDDNNRCTKEHWLKVVFYKVVFLRIKTAHQQAKVTNSVCAGQLGTFQAF